MSVLMLIVGAIALILGIGMVGFGIPINEFSFGNTLIEAGTTAASCGLVLIGLGAVVAQLQRIADGLAMWTPARPASRMAEMFEPGTPTSAKMFPKTSTSWPDTPSVDTAACTLMNMFRLTIQ